MTNTHPTPSQAERMIDELALSPEMEAWLIGAIQEYTFAMSALTGLYAKARPEKSHVE